MSDKINGVCQAAEVGAPFDELLYWAHAALEGKQKADQNREQVDNYSNVTEDGLVNFYEFTKTLNFENNSLLLLLSGSYKLGKDKEIKVNYVQMRDAIKKNLCS